MKFINFNYLVDRYTYFSSRLSTINKEHKWGIKYLDSYNKIESDFNYMKNNSMPMVDLYKSHANDNMSIKNYVLKFYCQNQEPPKCLCGCDQFVSWHQTQYKFNQYVNGHNDAGFKVKQIVFSAEQIQKRNISIKKRYDEDPSVKQKISNAIHNKH